MGVELVVLDFDGTLTDVDIEAVPFVEGYKQDVSKRFEISRDVLEKDWTRIQSIVEANPSKYGSLVNGMIVAPAYADPLIMSRTVADILFKEYWITDERERKEMLDGFFDRNYGKLGIAFKKETDRFLTALKRNISCCVMTNSGTDAVVKKIAQLPSNHSDIPVYGDAKKSLVMPEWTTTVHNTVEKEGFGRPLFVRRQKYFNALNMLMQQHGLKPENVAVVGDIYELDLLLPEMIGMHTVLLPRDKTPAFETNAVIYSPNGYVARSLDNALDYVLSLTSIDLN